jgi:hypothetical protein
MTEKTRARFLLFALWGLALWFFGNLYEGVVIAPNLLANPVPKVRYWQAFFTVTNPVFFYIPLTPLAALTIFLLYFKTAKENIALKRHLGYAAFFLIVALGLSIFIITQINLQLFFGAIPRVPGKAYQLSALWNILNTVRLIFLAGALYQVFRAYLHQCSGCNFAGIH